MNHITTLLGVAVLATALPATAANDGEPLERCVQLSDEHRGASVERGSQLLLKDGRSHYRVSFEGRCATLARARSVFIGTGGEHNRLCPQGTTVSAREDSCSASMVELIDAATYDRQMREAHHR